MLLFAALACEPPPPDGGGGGASPAAEESARSPGTIENEDAREVVHAFHEALAEGDSARVLELLHPEALIYEAGHAETVEEYRAGHLPADIAFAGAVEREVLQEEVRSLGEAALYVAETRARGDFRGREIDSTGVETVVLTWSDGAWRIVHVHWSSR